VAPTLADGGGHVGETVGLVVGAVLAFILCCCCALFLLLAIRRRRKHEGEVTKSADGVTCVDEPLPWSSQPRRSEPCHDDSGDSGPPLPEAALVLVDEEPATAELATVVQHDAHDGPNYSRVLHMPHALGHASAVRRLKTTLSLRSPNAALERSTPHLVIPRESAPVLEAAHVVKGEHVGVADTSWAEARASGVAVPNAMRTVQRMHRATPSAVLPPPLQLSLLRSTSADNVRTPLNAVAAELYGRAPSRGASHPARLVFSEARWEGQRQLDSVRKR